MGAEPKTTPFLQMHQKNEAKCAEFAGYQMAMSYPLGALREHLHCRSQAALFDVSHMGQLEVEVADGQATADCLSALEHLIPSNLATLAEGKQRYGLLLSNEGTILDDLMVMHGPGYVRLVVNAATAETDMKWISQHLPDYPVRRLDRALLALQGPMSASCLARLFPGISEMGFMDVISVPYQSDTLIISRSGYTGEDGFEISVSTHHAHALAAELEHQDEIEWAGLIARDSLRLEAGLPLYGQDMSDTVSVVEAGLAWAVGTARRPGGSREGGFIGARRTLTELQQGSDWVMCGVIAGKGPPVRAHASVYLEGFGPEPIGIITSGGPAPTCGYTVGMMRIKSDLAAVEDGLFAEVRGRKVALHKTDMPFVPHRYFRKPK